MKNKCPDSETSSKSTPLLRRLKLDGPSLHRHPGRLTLLVVSILSVCCLAFAGCKSHPKELHGVWVRSWDVECARLYPRRADEFQTTAVIVYEFKPDGSGRRFQYDYTKWPRFDAFHQLRGYKLTTPEPERETPITWRASNGTIHVKLKAFQDATRTYDYEIISETELSAEEEDLFEPLLWRKLDLSYDEALAQVGDGIRL